VLHDADLIVGIGLDPVELIPAPWPYPAPLVLIGGWPVDDSTYFGDRLVAEVAGDLPTLLDLLAGVVSTTWASDDASSYRAGALARLRAAVPARPSAVTPQDLVTIARVGAAGGR